MFHRYLLAFCCASMLGPLADRPVDAASAQEDAAARRSETPQSSTGSSPARWAILASGAIVDCGLSDLLTAKLSQLHGIELVEREAFGAIAQEYRLHEVLGAESVHHRLHLGRILGADRLLLLSREEVVGDSNGTTPVIRLVIADCHTGARIAHESLSAQFESDALIDSVIATVRETRAKYPAGVDHIVGVSCFVSNNLLHAYDHEQAGYAHLLQRALALHPGTAVLEIEEARAIAQELSLTGAPTEGVGLIDRRHVPILVDGEFVVSRNHAAGTQSVALTVRIRRGVDVDEIHKSDLTPAEAVAFLTGELPRRILAPESKEMPSFSPQEQHDWLVARAEQFGRIGAWDHSLSLREAALLLDPDDVPLRLLLMREYDLLVAKPLPVPGKPELLPSEDEIREMLRARVDRYLTRLAHLEFLIHNRKIDADQILLPAVLPGRTHLWFESFTAWRVAQCIPKKIVFDVHSARKSREAETLYRRLGQEELGRAEQAEAGFMESTFPRIRSLRNFSGKARARWAEVLLKHHLPEAKDGLRIVASPKQLDRLLRIVDEEFLDGFPLSGALVRFLVDVTSSEVRTQWELVRQGQLEPEEACRGGPLVEFLNKLAESDRPVIQLYGRFGLLHREWILWQQRWHKPRTDFFLESRRSESASDSQARVPLTERSELPAELPALAEEARQLIAFYESLERPRDRPVVYLHSLRRQIEGELASLSPAPRRVSTGREWTHYTPGEEDRLARYEFTDRIDMVVRTLAGESRPIDDPEWRMHPAWDSANRLPPSERFHPDLHRVWYPIAGWRACARDFDVLWNDVAVLVMREKGLAEEILSETQPRYLDVKWDGRQFWIVTQYDGVRVVSPTGDVLRRVGAGEGLPPYDRAVVVHPLEPDVVCIVGSFGEQRRGWCAMIDLRNHEPIRVFHEATLIRSHVLYRELKSYRDVDAADWTFAPTYAHEHRAKPGEPPLLLIGRAPDSSVAIRSPLVVNLETLEVSTFHRNYEPFGLLGGDFSKHGRDFFLFSSNGAVFAPYYALGGGPGPGVVMAPHLPPYEDNRAPYRPYCTKGGNSRHLIPLGDWLYVPGTYWYRIHQETFEEEPMLAKSGPRRFEIRPYTLFRVSSHYGIVVTNYVDHRYSPYRQVLIHEPQ